MVAKGIYIGQTGGIGMLKKTITRFMQHLRSARSWNNLFGKLGIRGLGLLYPTMFRLGPEQFGVVILEACPKHAADVRELFWIRKMGHTLNVRGAYPTDRKWKLLLNSNMVVPNTPRHSWPAWCIASRTNCDAMYPVHNGGQKQKWPTSEQIGYIGLALCGVPKIGGLN